MTREDMMRLALRQAEEAFAAGEVPVGCVIADAEGKIIGAGRNRREETHRADAHAEIEAIGQACEALGTWHLEDCTLCVTLEPCPMCAGAIINARVGTVVYGAKEANFGSWAASSTSLRSATATIRSSTAACSRRNAPRCLRTFLPACGDAAPDH